jgi:hypothetical protein
MMKQRKPKMLIFDNSERRVRSVQEQGQDHQRRLVKAIAHYRERPPKISTRAALNRMADKFLVNRKSFAAAVRQIVEAQLRQSRIAAQRKKPMAKTIELNQQDFCPFCGRSNLEVNTDHESISGEQVYYVFCIGCNACGPTDYYELKAVSLFRQRQQQSSALSGGR